MELGRDHNASKKPILVIEIEKQIFRNCQPGLHLQKKFFRSYQFFPLIAIF